jgi:translocator protein
VSAAALVGGRAGARRDSWYDALSKPSYQPPPVAFPVVWTVLYGDLALVGARVLDRLDEQQDRTALRRFAWSLGTNLALNASWTWMFFRAHRPWPAALHSAVLTVSAADLVRQARAVDAKAAGALLPYPLWCAFATVLSTAIARRNSV